MNFYVWIPTRLPSFSLKSVVRIVSSNMSSIVLRVLCWPWDPPENVSHSSRVPGSTTLACMLIDTTFPEPGCGWLGCFQYVNVFLFRLIHVLMDIRDPDDKNTEQALKAQLSPYLPQQSQLVPDLSAKPSKSPRSISPRERGNFPPSFPPYPLVATTTALVLHFLGFSSFLLLISRYTAPLKVIYIVSSLLHPGVHWVICTLFYFSVAVTCASQPFFCAPHRFFLFRLGFGFFSLWSIRSKCLKFLSSLSRSFST